MLDTRTVLVSFILSSLITTGGMVSLWWRTRGRATGPGYWLASGALQSAGLALLAFRGAVPVTLSIVLGVPTTLTATLLLYVGLERYFGRPSPQRVNIAALAALTAGHLYYTLAVPDIVARNILFSIGLLVLCGQAAWLVFRRADPDMRRDAWVAGVIFVAYCVFSIGRIVADLVTPTPPDLFSYGLHDVLPIMIFQMLSIGLTVSILLLVTYRLIRALETDIAARTKAEDEVRELNAHLEERVRERTGQLEASMRELAGFSYSVSHDLRAPLRAIGGYARVLQDEHGPLLDDEGRRISGVIGERAQHMGRLIDGLIEYSRVGRAPLRPETVDLAALAQAVFDDIVAPDDRRRTSLRTGPLPKARADAGLVRQVLVSLIDNAVKFSSRTEHAVVEVGSVDADPPDARDAGFVIYRVRDNGAGFDMQYADKLFGVFHRVHQPGEFDGTGIGLAMVERIVDRHGGRVWAESSPGAGAAFYFTLPAAGRVSPAAGTPPEPAR
jgi:signal transduction histidine kinase